MSKCPENQHPVLVTNTDGIDIILKIGVKCIIFNSPVLFVKRF